MTSRERLLCAMRLDGPGELPIHVRGVPAWDDQWVQTRDPSYAPVVQAVRQYGDYCANWAPPSGPFLSQTTVATDAERIDHPDWVETITTWHTPGGDLRTRHLSSKRGLPGMQMEFAVKSPEDVERVLSVPYVPLERVDASGFFSLRERIGDRGVVIASAGQDPIGHVHDLMGSDLLAIWSIEQRSTLCRLIEVFLRRILDRLEAILAANVGPIFGTLGQEYITPPLHGPRDFLEFCLEPEKAIIDRIHRAGGMLHVHCHGPLSAVLEDFARIADVLHPIEAPPMGDLPLAEAKRRIGDRVCLEGNVQIGDIYALPTHRLLDAVRKAIDDGAPGGGFILCPTASPYTQVLTDLTVRNYVAMIQTAAEYGRG